MVEIQDPEAPERTRPFRPRLPAVVAAAVIAIVGLALFPDQDSSRNLDPVSGLNSFSVAPASVVDPDSNRVGFIGLPPEGAQPSLPESGELLLQYLRSGPRYGWVYLDGRVIRFWHVDLPEGATERVTGLLEQRLTPEGIELLLSEIPATVEYDDDFHGYDFRWVLLPDPEGVLRFVYVGGEAGGRLFDPESWLPTSAWEDPALRAYVPSKYMVCYVRDVLPLLPVPAQGLLIGKDALPEPATSGGQVCSDLTTEEARALGGAIDEWLAQNSYLGGPGDTSWFQLSYHINHPRDDGYDNLWFEPYLPDGVHCLVCG